MQDYAQRFGGWGLIVGGSEGLGRAIAEEAARRRLNLAIIARREGLLRDAARAIADTYGVETLAIPQDMGAPDAPERIAVALGDRPVGFMVYNCAAEPEGEFLRQDLAAHLENLAVNCAAPTRLVHHFGRAMVARGRGGIVLCSSLAANQGIYSYASYGAAKAYEMILGEGLWDELAAYGVHATTLMVGSTYTPNFQRNQRRKKTLFAEQRTPPDLPEGVPVPQAPEDAAAELFRQLDGHWSPLIYANPQDEARAATLRSMSRTDLVKRMGDAMRSGYRSMSPAAS